MLSRQKIKNYQIYRQNKTNWLEMVDFLSVAEHISDES